MAHGMNLSHDLIFKDMPITFINKHKHASIDLPEAGANVYMFFPTGFPAGFLSRCSHNEPARVPIGISYRIFCSITYRNFFL